MRRLGHGFFFTSLLAAASVLAGDVLPDPSRVATAELEASLARSPDVYLVLDPPRSVLEVKARGLVLDTIPLSGIEVVTQQPLLGAVSVELPRLPAIWTVSAGPGDTDREIIAPETLRPYSTEDEDEPEPTPTPASAPPATASPAPTATPIAEPPITYRSHLANGWDLWVTNQLPPHGLWQRFCASVSDGWARLRGFGVDHPPTLALAVAGEDAQRLHHLMRQGVALLVASGAP